MANSEEAEPRQQKPEEGKTGDEIPHDIIPAEVADNVPEELKDLVQDLSQRGEKDIARRLVAIVAEEHYSGPLPHPRMLAQYKDVLPDAPDRILRMAEKQQDHRTSLESRVIEGDVHRADLGLILGFILFITFAVGGIVLLFVGKEIQGYVALGTSLVGGIGNFIKVGRERDKAIQEQKKKRKKPFINLNRKKTTKTPT